MAINYGVSGPMLRASGVKYDIRKNDPYSIYNRFDFDIPVGQGLQGTVGDTWDRYWVKVLEIEESLKIVEQAIEQIPEGDVKAAIPKKIKPPVGTAYGRVENPRGELGFFVVSDGGNNPFRVKVRPPSFCNLSVINEICKNNLVSDVVAILGSTDIVLGEVDR
jgi:NADH-quinone oxidoreductase subunit D